MLAIAMRLYHGYSLCKEMQHPSDMNFALWMAVASSVHGLVPELGWMGEQAAVEVDELCWEKTIRIL